MALELVYTSAARGLRSEGGGFCTVAMTRGMPPAIVPRLEALSGYRPGPSGDGPPAHCFFRIESPAGTASVVATIGPAPPDHTARTNKIASFLVLGGDELRPAGPSWTIAQPGLLRGAWSGDPAWIEEPVHVPGSGEPELRPCAAWQRAAGDAGWAGTVASAFLRDQSRPVHVIYPDGTDALELVHEVMLLLPAWARWRATFSTYFLQSVAGVPCALRFCLEGTPAAEAARSAKGLVVDLVRGCPGAPDSRHARMARSGVHEPEGAAEPEPVRAPAGDGLDLSGLREESPRRTHAAGSQAAPRMPTGRGMAAPGRNASMPREDGAQPMRVAIVATAVALLVVAVALVAWAIMPSAPGDVVPSPGDAAPATVERSHPERSAAAPTDDPPAPAPAPRPAPAREERSAPRPPAPEEPRLPALPAVPPAAPAQPIAVALEAAAFDWKADPRVGDLESAPRAVFTAPADVKSLTVDLGRPAGLDLRAGAREVSCQSRQGNRSPTLGAFEWKGREVQWAWRRVDVRANGEAIAALRAALGTARIEATLVDGRVVRCEAPPVALRAAPSIGETLVLDVPFPPGVDAFIAAEPAAAWTPSPGASPSSAALSGLAGDLRVAWIATSRRVEVAWTCPEIDARASAGISLASARAELAALQAAEPPRPAAPPAAGSKDAEAAAQRASRLAAAAGRVKAAEDEERRLAAAIAARAAQAASPAFAQVRTADGRVLARIEVTPRRPAGRKDR